MTAAAPILYSLFTVSRKCDHKDMSDVRRHKKKIQQLAINRKQEIIAVEKISC